ncbi:hypothetical protein SORBI_3004G149150 [Sorghum bicolor]|uniref:Uncharacterized protein n=1 Tax=Sorghum bicolor TaxID=4558 RepID=A0A1Z5RMM6_SORBI|nr:hypothetical protein SORBI_3004G149150 [Sorghum bicolor]
MCRTACSLQFHKQLIFRCNHTYLAPSMAAQEDIKFCCVADIPINYSACKFQKHLSKIIVKKCTKNSSIYVCIPNPVEYFHSCPLAIICVVWEEPCAVLLLESYESDLAIGGRMLLP